MEKFLKHEADAKPTNQLQQTNYEQEVTNTGFQKQPGQ
jgi:hypothetical protein